MNFEQAKDKILIGLISIITMCAAWAAGSINKMGNELNLLNQKMAVVITQVSYHDKKIVEMESLKEKLLLQQLKNESKKGD